MKKRIISLDINQGSKAFYLNKITKLIYNKERGYVCFSNVHMLIEAYDDIEFSKVVNTATFALPDGFPVAKSFKYLYGIKQERIAGMDFLPEFLTVCNDKKFKIAFIGSTIEVLNKTKHKIEKSLPNIEITALISPPFNKPWDNNAYIEEINSKKTDAVFVALGCPKQEKWMYQNRSKVNAVMFGIGGALPTYVGTVKRAPEWMQKFGLEWLFRLIKEPKRMFKRYFYTNSKFIYLLIYNMFKTKGNEE